MEGMSNFSDNVEGLAQVEQGDDYFIGGVGDELVFRYCESLPTLLISKKWQEIVSTLAAVSEALSIPENR
jgi:hypothetical protein